MDSWVEDFEPLLNWTETFARAYHQPGKKCYLIIDLSENNGINIKANSLISKLEK